MTTTQPTTALTATSKTGKTYRLRTRSVGMCFGTVGEVVARNGRVVATTDLVPYGFTAAALGSARALAESL